MSHLTVFVFLLVALNGIAIVHGKQKCERRRKGGFLGKCFSSPGELAGYTEDPQCDSLLLRSRGPTGCRGKKKGCCIKCSRQTKLCHKRFRSSVSRSEVSGCCPSELQLSPPVRPGSGCVCCKECIPKKKCKRKNGEGRCITKFGSPYNVEWCMKQINPIIYKRRCRGWGCWCCTYDKPT